MTVMSQIFRDSYAYTLGGYIANSNPRIQRFLSMGAILDALLSNLEKNPRIKIDFNSGDNNPGCEMPQS